MSVSTRIDPSLCVLLGGSGRCRSPAVSGPALPALLRSRPFPLGMDATAVSRACPEGA
jgi:hypothetical protein